MTSNGKQNGNGNGIGTVSNLGYPRIGEQREWKKALEAYWKGELPEERLEAEMKRLRLQNIKKQHDAGVDLISAGDFTRYDHVLDHTVAFGLVPERFGGLKADGAPALYFAMARGAEGIAAGEMTKWFNTNYHYIVPEWGPESAPALRSNPWLAAFEEAKTELGLVTKPKLRFRFLEWGQYIKFLSNERLSKLGLDILYPEITEHPMKWVESFSNMNGMKTDFFEQKVTNYSKSSNLNWGDL